MSDKLKEKLCIKCLIKEIFTNTVILHLYVSSRCTMKPSVLLLVTIVIATAIYYYYILIYTTTTTTITIFLLLK